VRVGVLFIIIKITPSQKFFLDLSQERLCFP
jgi:hypothetical protein